MKNSHGAYAHHTGVSHACTMTPHDVVCLAYTRGEQAGLHICLCSCRCRTAVVCLLTAVLGCVQLPVYMIAKHAASASADHTLVLRTNFFALAPVFISWKALT